MRATTKGPEPPALAAYRAVPGATYDGKDFTPVKDAIRDALLRDQLALCCYCMRRISKETRPHPTSPDAQRLFLMKIEHWQSQVAFPAFQLLWRNMLGACPGGEGSAWEDQTCDTRKGEQAISLNPLDETHVATLWCTSGGRLVSTNPSFQEDIDERLNLNGGTLCRDRRTRLTYDLSCLRRKHPGELPESAVRRLITEVEEPVGGKSIALSCVLRLWARKRFGGSW